MTDEPKAIGAANAADSEKEALELLQGGGTPSPEQLRWHATEPPFLDPDRAQSPREAGLLLRAVFSTPTGLSLATEQISMHRAGYAIVGLRSSDDTRVFPRLAEALASGVWTQLQARFSDLWAVDWLTWKGLGTGDPRTIGTAWLSSPGRRLLSDLDVLRALRDDPSDNWDPGPTDLRPERLRAAIGIDSSAQHHADWIELHKAVPGAAIHEWVPRRREPQVPLVIAQLERGMPPMLRGAALAWLLNQTVNSPIYTVDALSRDLRQDLPVRLATAFATQGELAEHNETGRRLEATLLQHVTCMAATTLRDWTTPELWHLARWLHGALVRSPWFGGDLPALVERLRAHLPASSPRFDSSIDPLHPARFRDIDNDAVNSGLDTEELAIVVGALGHYVSEPNWTPVPRPLVQELRRIARRPLNEGEKQAEAAMGVLRENGVPDEMGWNTTLGPHLAPPVVARWLLSRVKSGWMDDASSATDDASVMETLGLFENDPSRYQWLCFAWMEEGPNLPEPAQRLALETWARLAQLDAPPPAHCLAALGAGVLAVMSTRCLDDVITQARESEPPWRARLLSTLAERLPPETNHWSTVIDALLAQARDPKGDDTERLESALLALRRLGAIRRDADHDRLQNIADLVEHPPFVRHSGLRREIRRLGFTPRPTAGAN